MSKAFLSHSSVNKPLVEKIAKQLGRNNCHYDSLTFEAGNLTLDEIIKGLDDTDVFVLFISNAALNSKWVQDEITFTKTRLEKKDIERIFPIIIERGITYSDDRIPDWIKKPYNIKFFDNEVIILKKIQQLLRESNLKKYSHLQKINDLFVGRHDLLSEFERKVFTLDNIKPSGLIAHSYFAGIGRRTFLKNALIKARIIDKLYDPIQIPFDNRESIEDFIYKLSFVEPQKEVYEYDLSVESMERKVEIATMLLSKYIGSGELIFMIDEGGIVLPNRKIVPWFEKVISNQSFHNQVTICIVSKYKPDIFQVRRMKNISTFQLNELNAVETQTLFVQFLDRLALDIQRDDIKFFLSYLHGIPAQIISAGKLIDSVGINEARSYVDEIEENDHFNAIAILEHLKDFPTCIQMLIAFSKIEIVSYNLIYQIFGENDTTYESIQRYSI